MIIIVTFGWVTFLSCADILKQILWWITMPTYLIFSHACGRLIKTLVILTFYDFDTHYSHFLDFLFFSFACLTWLFHGLLVIFVSKCIYQCTGCIIWNAFFWLLLSLSLSLSFRWLRYCNLYLIVSRDNLVLPVAQQLNVFFPFFCSASSWMLLIFDLWVHFIRIYVFLKITCDPFDNAKLW